MTKEELIEEIKQEKESLHNDIQDSLEEIKAELDGFIEEEAEEIIQRKCTTLDWLMDSYDGYLSNRINEFNNNVEELIEAYEEQEEE